MTMQPPAPASRRPARRKAINTTIRPDYVAEARELGINLSETFERALEEAIRKARGERWLEENRAALESSNAWVEKHGLPLAGKRLF